MDKKNIDKNKERSNGQITKQGQGSSNDKDPSKNKALPKQTPKNPRQEKDDQKEQGHLRRAQS